MWYRGFFQKSNLFGLMLIVILLLLVGTACASDAPAAEPPTPEASPLKVAWTLWPGNYPIAIAQELGLFEKHGVKIEPIFYELYLGAYPDFQAGKLDGVLSPFGDALLMDGRLPDSLRVVLVTDNSAGADTIIATADIATPTDLKGQQVGVSLGSFGELFARTMLQEYDLTLDDVALLNIGPETVPQALSNTIQAGHTWEPYTSAAVAQGYHVIFTSAEVPGLIPGIVFFSTQVTETRPEEVRAFIAAWFEAQDYWRANPEKGNALVAKFTGLKPEEVSTEGVKLFGLEDNLRTFTPGPDITSLYTSGKVNADFLISTGGLGSAPDVERLLDPSFLKK